MLKYLSVLGYHTVKVKSNLYVASLWEKEIANKNSLLTQGT